METRSNSRQIPTLRCPYLWFEPVDGVASDVCHAVDEFVAGEFALRSCFKLPGDDEDDLTLRIQAQILEELEHAVRRDFLILLRILVSKSKTRSWKHAQSNEPFLHAHASYSMRNLVFHESVPDASRENHVVRTKLPPLVRELVCLLRSSNDNNKITFSYLLKGASLHITQFQWQ